MVKVLRLILLGFAVWVIPFGIGMAIFPVVPPESALFDTLMSVSMAFSATLFSIFHFSQCDSPKLDEGLLTGTVWMLMSLALDTPLFIFGPEMMRMTPSAYLADIGFTYFMIPIIAAGIAHSMRRR
ncbi:MAG: hypothetical protein ABL973_10430 [Micropepsaceae bacterium]